MSNPVFDRIDREANRGYASFGSNRSTTDPDLSAGQLQDLYNQPSASPVQQGRLTVDDVVMKALALFGIVLVTAAASWFYAAANPEIGQMVWMGGMIGTIILGFVIAFKKVISVPLIVGYAVLEGLFVGAVSQMFEAAYAGLVPTAVIATLSVFAGMFAAYRFGLIKVNDKFRRTIGMAIIGYAIFAVVNFIAAMMGVGDGWGFGGSGPLGIAISVFAVGLASLTLAMDFDSIDRAVAAGAPEKYSWLLAHGLIVTLVWLYIEMLRLLGRLRD